MSANLYNGTTGQLEPFAGRESDDRFVGTQAQWNALTTQEKAAYIGKDVMITDDEEDAVATVTTDGTETWKTFCNKFYNAVKNLIDYDRVYVIKRIIGTTITWDKVDITSDTLYVSTMPEPSGNDLSYTRYTYATSNSSVITKKYTGSGWSDTDISNNTVSARTFKLIALN